MLDVHLEAGLQRSCGEARLILGSRAGAPRIAGLQQSGSAKVMLPDRDLGQAIFLNTSGGLTGGDRLRYELRLAAGLSICATTQTAERAYASLGEVAVAEVALDIGDGASLDWLPQETLIYEHARLQRRINVTLGHDARLLLTETVVLGRHAMGELTEFAGFRDFRLVSRDHRPIWAESLHVDAATLASRSGKALLGKARCFSTIALIAPDAVDHLGRVNDLLCAEGCAVAASAWNGRLILRLVSEHLWPLRQQVAQILIRLRGKPVPRVWQLHGDIL